MPQWVSAALHTVCTGVFVGLVVGVLMACFNRRQKSKEDDASTAKRKDALVISLLVATAELSYAITMAIKRGSPNGEVETAVTRYNKAMQKFREFERENLYMID